MDLGGGVKMELVLIPAGEFKMGSGESAEATAAFFNKTYGEDFWKQTFSRTSIRSTGSNHQAVLLGHLPRHAGPVPAVVADAGYRTDAEKGVGFPRILQAGTPTRKSST